MARPVYKSDSPLTGNDCMNAYEKLTDEEKDEISSIVRQVIGKVNKRNSGFSALGLGENGALELIAKVGIFLNQQERVHTAEQALQYLNGKPT